MIQRLFTKQLWRFCTVSQKASQVLHTNEHSQHSEPKIDESKLLFKQKLQPYLNYHQSISFNISSYNEELIPLKQQQQDRIYLAFFRKFQGVKTYQHSKRQSDPTQKTNNPRSCWYQIQLPFESEAELRTRFQRHYSDSIRVSKLLEVLDHIATKIGYSYCYNDPSAIITTSYVDHMNFFNKMNSFKDLYICGYPTYQKGSEIEVQIDLKQKDDNGQLQLVSCASFLLQVKDKQTNQPYEKTPQFSIEGEESPDRCQNRFNVGQENTHKRQYGNLRANLTIPPEKDEINEVHQLFMKNRNITSDSIQIDATLEQKILLMQSQERNLNGQIYGGHLMKESIDLSWISAYNHVNTVQHNHINPEISYIDDFQFLSPVEVSNIINFESKVVYTYKNYVMVRVQCQKLESISQKSLTNQMYIIYRIDDDKPIKQVIPITYNECLTYLEAKRRFHAILTDAYVQAASK
ncbi:hypothetical protein ABPG74_009633 [Tetrahymena malaccensis]